MLGVSTATLGYFGPILTMAINTLDNPSPTPRPPTPGCNTGCGGDKCSAKLLAECGDPGSRANMSGQPCLWFSQGCGIGCPSCDNHTQHSMGAPLCAGQMAPTLPKRLWTLNRNAKEDPAKDSFKFHPWRAPGFAPVVDVCGVAGGGPHPGGGAGVFTKTQWAQQGDAGSRVLPPSPSGTVWTAGTVAEVAWGLRANHGGGYQYRICPSTAALTEDCMQRNPLPFAPGIKSFLRYNNGTAAAPFTPVDVSTGTHPANSTWRQNPLPLIVDPTWTDPTMKASEGCTTSKSGFPTSLGCRQFDPIACEEDAAGLRLPWGSIPGFGNAGPEVMGSCSGNQINAAIVDKVVIPTHLPAGSYVVGFRWDCEETAQVWSSCGDVTVVANGNSATGLEKY